MSTTDIAAAEAAALERNTVEEEAYRRFELAREQWLAARRDTDAAWGAWAVAMDAQA